MNRILKSVGKWMPSGLLNKLYKRKAHYVGMLSELESVREKFLQVFANLHDDLRETIIVVVDGKPYTWNTSFLEIKDKTGLGEKILKTLKDTGIL